MRKKDLSVTIDDVVRSWFHDRDKREMSEDLDIPVPLNAHEPLDGPTKY
jgi:hypothetical protein